MTFAPGARADYEAVLAWYAARSPQAATGFEAEVECAAESLGRFPEAFALADDRHRACPVRRYPYSLVYRYEAGRL